MYNREKRGGEEEEENERNFYLVVDV